MYENRAFGAPPPIFTPPPAPYNPKHHAYATGKQLTSSSEMAKLNTKVRKDAPTSSSEVAKPNT